MTGWKVLQAILSEADIDAMLEAEEVQRCKDFFRGPSDGRDKGENHAPLQSLAFLKHSGMAGAFVVIIYKPY